MENKIRLIFLTLIAIFSISAYSQTAESEKFYNGEQDDRFFEEYKGPSQDSAELTTGANDSGYYLVNTEKGLQFVQRLVWEDSGYVDHYTITIEQYDSKAKKYNQVAEVETEINSCEVSLSAGTYRYKIAIYNILGQLEIETDWEEFSIEVAYEPQIRDVSPSALYMEEKPEGNFVIGGRNIRSNAKIVLRRDGKKGGGYLPDNVEISSRGNRVNLHFAVNNIAPGKYNIVITNPGGLTSVSDSITIRYKKPVDFDISAGYTCQFVLFDETINKYLDSSVFPLGAAVKMTFIPYKTPSGYFGTGILANISYMAKEFDSYKITGSLASAHLNFVYQKPFFERRFFIEAFIGGGICYFMNFQFEFEHGIKSPEQSAITPSLDAGFGFQYYFTRRLFADLTVPFIMAFPNGFTLGTINPQITVGWQF